MVKIKFERPCHLIKWTRGSTTQHSSDAKKLEATGLTETTNKLLMAKIQPKI